MLRIDAGEDPDFELLRDVMLYMTTYADTIHHPKEDVVYREMRAAGSKLANGLEGVEADHREIANFGKALRDDIEAVVSGAAVTRERILRDMIDYVHRQRKHMAWEEGDLFLRADALAEGGIAAVGIAGLDVDDPVFGATDEGAFRNLLAHLQRAAGN